MSDAEVDDGPPADPCLDALMDGVRRSPLPAVVLAVPSEEILGASPSARVLLTPTGTVVGRSFEQFASDAPSGAMPLLLQGQLAGYEVTRQLAGDGAVRVWVRRAECHIPPRYALGVLSEVEGEGAPVSLPVTPAGRGRVVLGATDPNLIVDRLSVEVEDLLGVPVESLLGRSLLALVAPGSVVDLLWALSHAAATSTGVPVRLAFRSSDGGEVWVQVLLVPLEPAAACAFAFIGSRPEMTQTTAAGVAVILEELAGCVDAVDVSRRVAELRCARAGILSGLTARELDVVSRLVAGDRVPAIAKSLFLAQSTVRNVLSSVFAKLGVNSQQQLIDLLRESDEPSAKSDGLPLP